MLHFLQGFGVSGGLIVAIGAQNAFVLSQGVRRNYPFQTAIVCAFCDAMLIIIGISGVGTLVSTNPQLVELATWIGALFLFCYGGRAFRSALRGNSLEATLEIVPSRRQLLFTTLALTFLNPHVYIDTIILIGGISSQLSYDDRYWFGAGAVTASVVWFFSLSIGAGFLSPFFRKPLAWRLLDGFVCLAMWGIAVSLILPRLNLLLG
ncbi:MAG: LysE/ArgO family amino acid transporter [Thermodesulfobacteriota bacterium]|nr:LysE/ArgO family amino acid transporter [Thermodesulfobacteriota bacterium]